MLIYLLFLPEFPIIFTHYSLFIPMLSPIILYYSSNLIVSLLKLHMAAAKIVYFKIDNIINSSNSSYIFIIRLILDLFHYIHPFYVVPNNSIISIL